MSYDQIITVIPIHHRPLITIATLQRLSKQTDVLAVGSDDTDRLVANSTGCYYIEHPNVPLTMKYQAGLTAARELEPNGVLFCGSDTWLKDDWCDLMISQDKPVVAVDTWYMLRPEPLEIIKRRRPGIGLLAGKLYRTDALDAMNWKLWFRGSMSKAGYYSRERQLECSIKTALVDGPIMLTIKGNWKVINTYEKIRDNSALEDLGTVQNPARWLHTHFPGGWLDICSASV